MARNLRLATIVLLILIFPLSALLAKDYLVYRYTPERILTPAASAPSMTQAASIEEYAPIIEKKLFPTSLASISPIETAAAGEAPGGSSVLSELKLIGTFVGPRSFAIFERSGTGEQSAFKPGESVFDAGTLKSIEMNGAVVTSNGRDVAFTIADEKAPETGNRAPGKQPASIAPSGGGSKLSKKTGENQWVIDQRAVLSSLDNMGQVLTDARLTPKMKGGSVEGFLLTDVKARGVFDAIGLKNGDVLTSINGYKIDSPEKAVQVLSGLKGQTSVSLDIVRGGKNMSFSYQIR